MNGSQLYATNQAIESVAIVANTGWNLSAQGANNTNVAPGASVDLSNTDGNLVVGKTTADNNVTFDLAKDITVDSVTAGNSVLDTSGLKVNDGTSGTTYGSTGMSIAGGPSLTISGINAGGSTITNVAAGTNATDAVNLSQLQTAQAAATTHYYSVNDGGTPGENYNNDGATGMDSLAAGVGNAAGGSQSTAVGISNHAGGDSSTAVGFGNMVTGLSATAVGSVNLASGWAVTTMGNSNTAAGDRAVALGSGNNALGQSATAMGTANFAAGDFSTALGTNSSASGASATAMGHFASAGLDDAVAIGNNASANAQVGDVALGSGSTTEAVVGTAGTTINGTSYGFAGTSPTSTVSVGAAGSERTVTNVAAGRIGATSTDAINGSQLFSTNQAIGTVGTRLSNLGYSVASGLGGNSSYDPVTGTLSASFSYGGGTYNSVQSVFNQIGGVVNGGGIKYFHASSNLADSVAAGADSVAVGPQAVANDANSVAIGNGAQASGGSVALGASSVTGTAVPTAGATIAGTAYRFAGATPSSVVSVGAPGAERQITHVAAGQLSATSTDAVNGSQLYATNQAVGNLDAKVTSIGDQVSTVDGRVTHIENQVGAANTTINNLQNGQDGMFQVSADNTAAKPAATGTNSAAGGADAVASGSNSTAVGNGSQAVAANSVAVGQGSVAKRANSVSVGSAGNTRQITNVSAGTASTDAVNVSQLQASQAGNVQYDKNADGTVNNNSVTMNPGGDPTIIHNVGRGVANSDVANVGQLTDGINKAVDWSKSYTDQRFNTVNGQLNTIGNRTNGGVASAMAMASLPQAYQPNQSSAAVALGNFHGETGIAIGVSTITESGRYVFKVNATTNTRGDAGVGVGAAMVW